ncbi:MAG: hypothetical protein L3K06_04365 [Thermoplasmata archaeon]|nr:hypothetical protein [Thermoplasmata archaeon]
MVQAEQLRQSREEVARLSWPEVRAHLRRHWKPGQHLSVVAPTEYGKSHLVVNGLLPLWSYTLTLDIKQDGDPVVAKAGRRVRHYPTRVDLLLDEHHRYVLTPGYPESAAARTFGEALVAAWKAGQRERGKGSWTIYVDELRLATGNGTKADPGLGLAPALRRLWIAGRSRGLTIIGSNQAARSVPQEFYDQPKWHVFGNLRDDRVLYRISEIGTGDKNMIRATVPDLDDERHELLITGPGRFAARTIVT